MSSRKWINETGERAYIRAWLLDNHGRRMEESPWFAFGGSDASALPDLNAGQTTTLPASLATPDVDTYPAGEYALDAILVQLNLRCQPGTLTLT